MIHASCHCGAVRLQIAFAPKEITECNCSICRRYATRWAYYALEHVQIASGSGQTDVYMWDDRTIEFHRCATCGCISHWSPVDRSVNRMGVNARLIDPTQLGQPRLRYLDGANTERYLDDNQD